METVTDPFLPVKASKMAFISHVLLPRRFGSSCVIVHHYFPLAKYGACHSINVLNELNNKIYMTFPPSSKKLILTILHFKM